MSAANLHIAHGSSTFADLADACVREGFEPVDPERGWAIFAAEHRARIGLSVAALPVIWPVEYGLIQGSIVIPARAGGLVYSRACGAVVVLQVEHTVDNAFESAQAIGFGEEVRSPSRLTASRSWDWLDHGIADRDLTFIELADPMINCCRFVIERFP